MNVNIFVKLFENPPVQDSYNPQKNSGTDGQTNRWTKERTDGQSDYSTAKRYFSRQYLKPLPLAKNISVKMVFKFNIFHILQLREHEVLVVS